MNKLEKRSKNVREQTRNITPEQKKSRIMDYIRAAGFRAQAGKQDRFGIGNDQKGLSYNPTVGSPEHELAHALMTPVGEGLRDHQKKLGQVATPQSDRGMTPQQGWDEEAATFGMEPAIGRRAGVQITRGHGGPNRLTSESENIGRAQLHAFEEGRKTITPKGQVIPGNSVDAKINARNFKKSDIQMPHWLGKYPVLDEEHIPELERNAAIGEFGSPSMDRESAEGKAYEDYRKDRHREGAAHHLSGMKQAELAKDPVAAQKHSLMYEKHCKALGHNSVGEVHPEVQALMDKGSKIKFKPHKADALVLGLDKAAKPGIPVL